MVPARAHKFSPSLSSIREGNCETREIIFSWSFMKNLLFFYFIFDIAV